MGNIWRWLAFRLKLRPTSAQPPLDGNAEWQLNICSCLVKSFCMSQPGGFFFCAFSRRCCQFTYKLPQPGGSEITEDVSSKTLRRDTSLTIEAYVLGGKSAPSWTQYILLIQLLVFHVSALVCKASLPCVAQPQQSERFPVFSPRGRFRSNGSHAWFPEKFLQKNCDRIRFNVL